MGKLAYSARLFSEFIQFAKANKAWWMIPMMMVLALAGLLAFASQTVAPFIYTLF